MVNGNLKILVYGYGNPGRQDDGLGNALVEKLEQAHLPGVEFDSNYQLNIEDADNISGFDAVIFVDASKDTEPPFKFSKIEPSSEIRFTTHSMAPESVVALCQDIYNKIPHSYLLAIPGYEWEEMNFGLTSKALENLDKAYDFVYNLLKDPDLDEISSSSE